MDSWSDRRREEGTEEEEEERIRNTWLRQRDQHVQRPGEQRTDWGLLVPSGSGLPQSLSAGFSTVPSCIERVQVETLKRRDARSEICLHTPETPVLPLLCVLG